MKRIILALLLLTLTTTVSATDNIVRVRLFDGKGKINSVTISGDVPVIASIMLENMPGGLELSESWNLKATEHGMLLSSKSTSSELLTPVRFWVEAETGEPSVITVTANGISRRYRGEITVSPLPDNRGLLLINSLPQQEYLYGVIPAEVPASWPFESLRAQAILARTYSFANLAPNRSYDLVDSTSSQVYLGYDHEHPSTNRAVRETDSLVVGYEGRPVSSVYYFSTCGGQTEDCGQVWSQSVPYLVPVSCSAHEAVDLSTEEAVNNYFTAPVATYCSRSSLSRWEVKLTAEDLKPSITANISPEAELLDLKVTRRSPGGAALEVTLITDQGEFNINGEWNIRKHLGKNGSLRSSFFAIEKQVTDDCTVEYILRGGGWGHRVGVCQWGMEGMAREGASAEEILSHYLPGTQILSLDQSANLNIQ